MATDADGTMRSWIRSLVLDGDGLPDGTFQDVEGAKREFALFVAAAPAPGTAGARPSVLAVWQEGDSLAAIAKTASLRARFLGPY
jgi:hypothetical protein